METLLINEKLVSRFRYWQEDQVQQGMQFRQGLFRLAAEFSSIQRHQVFDLAAKLSARGLQPVITATASQYALWVSLRSPESQPTAASKSIGLPGTALCA